MRAGEGWEHFAHEADVGLRGFGPTKAVAFENAARAMMAVITDPANVKPLETVEIACEAPDDEVMLVDWLNALVFEMATRRMIFADFAVSFEGQGLRGSASGEAVDVARHEPRVEVKGATYTCLDVGRDHSGRWVAQCVVDV